RVRPPAGRRRLPRHVADLAGGMPVGRADRPAAGSRRAGPDAPRPDPPRPCARTDETRLAADNSASQPDNGAAAVRAPTWERGWAPIPRADEPLLLRGQAVERYPPSRTVERGWHRPGSDSGERQHPLADGQVHLHAVLGAGQLEREQIAER